MLGTLVYDLLIILAVGLVAGLACRRLGVSVLVGYLLVGPLLGQGCLGWVNDEHHELEYIAEAGVFLLLFSIGLEFSLDELRHLGRTVLVGGGVQMLLVGVPIGMLFVGVGLEWQPAMLIAAALSFSSTVLVFKALSERGHSHLPHGRRAIAILLFQDAALIPLLLLVPLLTGTGDLMNGFSVFGKSCNKCVAHFMVGHPNPLVFIQTSAASLRAGDNLLDGRFQIAVRNHRSTLPRCEANEHCRMGTLARHDGNSVDSS